MTNIISENPSSVVLQALVQLKLGSSTAKIDHINKKIAELLTIIDTSSLNFDDKRKLKNHVTVCQQKILEEKSDLYKVKRVLQSNDTQNSTINFLYQTIFSLFAERIGVGKLYSHVMSELFYSCILEKIAKVKSYTVSKIENNVIVMIDDLQSFTPEGFSVFSRLSQASKNGSELLGSELASIVQDKFPLEVTSKPILEFWKQQYLTNVVSSVADIFEEAFRSRTILSEKVEHKLKRASPSGQQRPALCPTEDLERFYTEEAEAIVTLYCTTMKDQGNVATSGRGINQAKLESLARSIVELGEKMDRRLRQFEPTYKQLWNFLLPHFATGHSEIVSPSAFASSTVPQTSIDYFTRMARSFVEPDELSRLCTLGYVTLGSKVAAMMNLSGFALPEDEPPNPEKELVEPLKNCKITQNAKPVKSNFQTGQISKPLIPPQEKSKRIRKPARISFNEGPLILAQRVADWFKDYPPAFAREPYKCRPLQQNEESKFLHTYPLLVTKLMRKNCKPEQYKEDTLYTCPGTISYYEGDVKICYEGVFADCFGVKSGELYHHFFHKKSFQKLVKDYTDDTSYLDGDEEEIKEESTATNARDQVVDSLEVANRFVIRKKRYCLEIDDTQKKLCYTLCFPEGLR